MQELDEKGESTATETSGRRYGSVEELMQKEGFSSEIQRGVEALKRQSKLSRSLAEMRVAAAMSQQALAKAMGVSQSRISKLESGTDDNITVSEIASYCKITGRRANLMFGKPLNHVEAVKFHASEIKDHLDSLAEIAHKDEEIEHAIKNFFSEAFFNILTILGKSQARLLQEEGFEVDIETSEEPKRQGTETIADDLRAGT